ncbi:hypothetical protein [Allorhodopirellula solitaria]|uniref:Uncharacterized protein n=1 Tax=Allorhodopirellula solitaria TaxID=2527987 RepID=A0A5C5WNJ4_9BACT|nr:hypothetical protein [Allorhodopirellula solitaria]TWT51775.1 hypothetical protein CA85_52010 [Allorhodopirellula solitaria]
MDIATATIEEWRELGFHYELDDDHHVWTLTGSRGGLGRFAKILRQFASDPRNDVPFEHDHYGPYGYLRIMNNPDERGFNSNGFFAPRSEFSKLADVIDSRLADSQTGSTIDLSGDFSPDSEYELRLIVAPDDFDPGLFDPWVQQEIREPRDAYKPPNGKS